MKKEYEEPKIEKVEFEPEDVILTSSSRGRCDIIGSSVTWQDAAGNTFSNSTSGTE